MDRAPVECVEDAAQARPRPARPAGADLVRELHGALGALDLLLIRAVQSFDAIQRSSSHDRFRGLYIKPEDVAELLARQPGEPGFHLAEPEGATLWRAEPGSFAHSLVAAFDLSQFDLDALLVALAPEYDLRYERIYAYLQDDVTRKRPTVNLILDLLTSDGLERLERRRAFSNQSPLRGQRLVQMVGDSQQAHPSSLAQYVKPDPQILSHLLGDLGLDERIKACAQIGLPETSLHALQVDDASRSRLWCVAALMRQRLVLVWLQGSMGIGKHHAAAALARELAVPLLQVRAQSVPAAEATPTLTLALREAWLRGALLYLTGIEDWLADAATAGHVLQHLAHAPCQVVLGSERDAPPGLRAHALVVPLPPASALLRARCWQAALARHGLRPADKDLSALANLYKLTPAQIDAAAADAYLRAGLRADDETSTEPPNSMTLEDCVSAARNQSGQPLAGLADKLEARATWADIVLPQDAQTQLHELCQRIAHRDRVFNDWGFAGRSTRGQGTAALFAGPSGTGKTMAAEVIANALGLDLYRIDLASVVSKYIGETEMNLDRIFTAAENANAILFFDEADALFGKRSEVKDSHDRYANLEISYLLQKMEQYEGITILATNLRQNLDEAFMRRLAFIVQFPFPDEAQRRRIWEGVWPREVRLAEGVELSMLARQVRLSGGDIKNIALAAAFLAMAEDKMLGPEHVRRAVEREFQKLGKEFQFLPEPVQGTAA